MSRKVLFLDTVHPILKKNLEKSGFACIENYSCSREELIKLLPDIFGIVIRSRFTLDKKILSKASSLKFIARSGSGMENIDVGFAESKGILCINSPEGNRDAVGEHVIGMLLSLLHKINTSDIEVREGKWLREANRGAEIGGKTVGIIGFGNTGSALGRKLSGFDCEVIAYDKFKSGYGTKEIKEVQLKDIFEHADIVSIHIPQNIDNLYYCNEDFFNFFKKKIYFVNTSRGMVLKTDALVAALSTRKVLGACIDVLEYEMKSFENLVFDDLPSAYKYLIKAKNVVLTPHVAGWTVESYEKLSKVLFDKISLSFID